MIERVVKSSWAWHETNKRNGFCFRVYYKGNGWKRGRVVTYTDRQNLPMTVVNFILSAGHVDTQYFPDEYNFKGRKRETYRA